MIYLITGSPGAGKTLAAMELIEKWGREHPERIIYSANIDGQCYPGVLPLDDAGVLSWHQHCEKDSLVVVDEAQRYWRAQRSGEPSQAIIEMETHRHDGIDIVLMTQHPTFLHANIRKLVNVHIHMIAYTGQSALRWEWREAHDDVQDTKLRSEGEFTEWKYPAHLYPFYKSATMHTKRAKRSSKQLKARIWGIVALVCVVGLIGMGIAVWHKFSSKKPVSAQPALSPSAGMPVVAGGSPASSGGKRWSSRRDYVADQIPRVPSQPWSAPLYDGQAVVAHPQVYCIASGDEKRCHCITEQGTRYLMPPDVCLDVAKNGPAYDPFRPAQRRDDDSRRSSQLDPDGVTKVPDDRLASLPRAPVLLGSSVKGYDRVVGSPSYTEPERTVVGDVGGSE